MLTCPNNRKRREVFLTFFEGGSMNHVLNDFLLSSSQLCLNFKHEPSAIFIVYCIQKAKGKFGVFSHHAEKKKVI